MGSIRMTVEKGSRGWSSWRIVLWDLSMTKGPEWDERNAHCDSTKGMTDVDEVPLLKVNSGISIAISRKELVHAPGVLFARDWGKRTKRMRGMNNSSL